MVWGKLAHFAGTLQKGAHIEIEGQLRYRTYHKEVPNGDKKVAVEITVSEVHASAIRKLDRNSSSAASDEDVSDEAPA